MIKLKELKKENENNNELNINYSCFMNCIYTFIDTARNQISAFLFDYNFKILIEFKNTGIKNNNIYLVNAHYKIKDHPFLELDIESSDENILGKKPNEYEGFKTIMNKLNLQNKESLDQIHLKDPTIIHSQFSKEQNNIENNNNSSSDINVDEDDYRIVKFERLIYKHEDSVKFILCLNNGYYFSCGNDTKMILYNAKLDKILIINNLDDILHHISEKKSDDENFIELIACYGKNIYLIRIDKTNLKYETKIYTIPNIKTLFCVQILNSYIITGINKLMQVEDLFNDNIDTKKMYKISLGSFKTGLPINNIYIAVISNDLITNGLNQLVICNLNNDKIIYTIKEYSFNINKNSLCLIKLKTRRYLLLCACKKYSKKLKNGILMLDMDLSQKENIKHKFYDTGNFEVFCFCQIFGDKIFFFAGGFDSDKRIGLIKLYRIKDNDKIKIKFLQDIDGVEEDKYFEGFNMPINNIIQKKDDGYIIITTIDGGIYLFSIPNLDYYSK